LQGYRGFYDRRHENLDWLFPHGFLRLSTEAENACAFYAVRASFDIYSTAAQKEEEQQQQQQQ
jgi:hypothetical protein